MKYLLFLSVFLFVINFGCKKQPNEGVTETCRCDNPTNQLNVAKYRIIGNWKWVETMHSGRGAKSYFETTTTTSSQLIYKFTIDTLEIISNNVTIYKEKYTVGLLRDFTNYQNDTALVVKYYNQNNLSFLQIDTNCMRLVNSYNDAGGDLIFKKM